jgi:hypothetical protein
LLRTGALAGALGPLEKALARRSADGPPLEELLLALAHAKRSEPARARKYLQAFLSWREQDRQPVHPATLAGLASRGPFAVLPALPVVPADSRLGPFGWPTTADLTALCIEADKALATSYR